MKSSIFSAAPVWWQCYLSRPGVEEKLLIQADAPPSLRHDAHGFSLIELLVVIAIIAILAGGLSLGLRGSSGSALKSATNLVAAQINSARTSAILNNAPALLLIDKSSNEANGSRRMGVVRQITDTNGTLTWERTGPYVRLPQGTFVVFDAETPFSTKKSENTPPDTTNFDGSQWALYKFSSTGACDENAGARILIAGGVYSGNAWTRPNKSMLQGLFLTRLGEAVFFEDPDQINSSFGGTP
jgi:prepilin-type N-terminal cleavage/methylation domain-containing protein